MSRLILVLAFLLLLPPLAVAQVESERDSEPHAEEAVAKPDDAEEGRRYLVTGDVTHSGYGGPHVKVSRIVDSTALFVGGRGGWIIGDHLVLGGGGYGLANRVQEPELGRIGMGYGGLFIEGIAFPHNLVHVAGGAMLGFGGVSYGADDTAEDLVDSQSRALLLLEPEVHAQLNITPFLQLAVGLSYRWIAGSGDENLSSEDLSALAGSFLLKFGWF